MVSQRSLGTAGNWNQAHTKTKAKVGCAFAGCLESGRKSRGSVSALDCRTVHQRRLTLQHPLAPQFRVRPEVGLISKEYSGFSPLGLLPQGGVLCHEGPPLGLISLEQTLLGALKGKPQPVKPVQVTAAAQADAKPF